MKEEKGLNDISHSSLLSATDISVAFVSKNVPTIIAPQTRLDGQPQSEWQFRFNLVIKSKWT